jgi:hypothetical protein
LEKVRVEAFADFFLRLFGIYGYAPSWPFSLCHFIVSGSGPTKRAEPASASMAGSDEAIPTLSSGQHRSIIPRLRSARWLFSSLKRFNEGDGLSHSQEA